MFGGAADWWHELLWQKPSQSSKFKWFVRFRLNWVETTRGKNLES